MRENDQILCNEELLKELREIEKVTISEAAGEERNMGVWTDESVSYLTILCC